jgi:hypothetical protein
MCPHGSAIKLEQSSRQTGHSAVTPKISRAVLIWRKFLPETFDLKWCTQLQQGHFKVGADMVWVASGKKSAFGRHLRCVEGKMK